MTKNLRTRDLLAFGEIIEKDSRVARKNNFLLQHEPGADRCRGALETCNTCP
jgi:hypothetical protein